jgi:excisionase family DNA binding protein
MLANMYLTAKQAAERLGVRVQTVYQRIADKSLPAVNMGTDPHPKWRIDEDELARFIARRTTVQGEPS